MDLRMSQLDGERGDSAGRARARRGLRNAVALVGAAAILASCSDASPTGTPPPDVVLNLTFTAQPSPAQAGAAIQPAVEVTLKDSDGNLRNGTVALELAGPNYCGANLSGTRSVATQQGVATFTNLSVDLLGSGYVLTASSGSATANSAAFTITSAITGETLTQETTICVTPATQSDASGLAYVPQDNVLWFADDNMEMINGIVRGSGQVVASYTDNQFMTAFPGAVCDDGDGNPLTACSYFDEFEVVASDRGNGTLYVVNTIEDPSLVPPVDKAAIFRLVRNGASNFAFDAWNALPEGFDYSGAVVVGGQLFLSDVNVLYPYDFATNMLDTANPALTMAHRIRGLSYDGTHLWVLTQTGTITGSESTISQIDWATGQVLAAHALAAFETNPVDPIDPAGLAVVGAMIYTVDGIPLNPVHVFTESAGG